MSWGGGDWMCGACQHQNFKKREACQLCGYPKLGGPDVSAYLYNLNRTAEALAGDWYCSAINCGAHNYASRTCCYRCGALKYDYAAQQQQQQQQMMAGSAAGFPPGWKTGDWICLRVDCGVHNYASRTECFKCKTARHYGNS